MTEGAHRLLQERARAHAQWDETRLARTSNWGTLFLLLRGYYYYYSFLNIHQEAETFWGRPRFALSPGARSVAHAGTKQLKQNRSVQRRHVSLFKSCGGSPESRGVVREEEEEEVGGPSGVGARGRPREICGRTLDMAGAKTFHLLVGVVLVLQCFGDSRGETPASDGKRDRVSDASGT